MASFRAPRPTKPLANARGCGVLARNRPFALAAAVFALAATLLLTVELASQPGRQGDSSARSFLTTALGAPQASTSLVREPRPGIRLQAGKGARFTRAGASVGLELVGAPRAAWTRHLRGASRRTPFGSELVVFRGEYGVEQFLRVDRRQGRRTWRWRLDAPGLTPTLAADGGVDFARGTRTAGIRITPAEIFDLERNDITPRDARWSLERARGGWTLALALDDANLPLPYVIDPNIARTGVNSAGSAGGVTSLSITRPGNVGDLLIAQITVRSNATINAPAGWSPVGSQQHSGTGLTQRVFSATGSATLSTTFSWTGAVHASGGISAYSDVHTTSSINASSANSGTGTTATATGVTTTYANSMIVALYGAEEATTATQSSGQGLTQHYTASSTGNPAKDRARATGADGLQAAAGASGDKTAALSQSVPWVAHLVALRREPPDGGGTMTVDRSAVAASSTGNTLVFTFTPPSDGLVAGEVRVTVPTGWSAPSLVGTNAGYTTSSTGTLTLSGNTIIVSNLTTTSAFTITYGSTALLGPGATAPATTGAQTWTTQTKGTSTGTLTDIASQPSVSVNAANGSGTMTASRSNVAASSTGNTITFTYTAATGGMTNGSVSIDVPASWSAPSTTGSNAGYTTSTAGTVGVSGQTITVSGLTLAAGATFDIVYGSTAGGGPAATASSSTGAVTWQAKQRSTNVGTLANLAASPSITQNAPNGSGSLAASPSTVGYGTTANTITFTYTAAAGGTANGSVSVDVPSGWSAPSTTATAAGYTTSTAGTVGVSGQTITVSGVTLSAGGTFDIVYGSTAGGGPGATAPASAGAATWQGKQRSTNVGSLANLTGGSPSITVAPQPSAPSSLATSPASPANDTSPEVTGTADAGNTVRIYKTTDCSGAVAASGTTAAFASPGITVSVTDNATTQLSARATDAYGAVSPCSSSISYTADSTPPGPPASLDSSPGSPANDNSPSITGTADAGTTVRLYSTSDCSGAPVASGTAASFATPGFSASVSDNTSTTFKATATDAANNTSSCSGGFTYVEDSAAPNAPSGVSTAPASPANDNDPNVTGMAEAGSTVSVYASADCTGPVEGTGSAATFAGSGIDVANVADNSSTSYSSTATDAAGNTSACSSSTTYVEDSAAPAAPSGLSTTPASPASTNDPKLTGTAEAGSTVSVYATADCTGAPVGSGSAALFGGAGLDPTDVADNSTTTYTATAADAAGNVSACSSAVTYVEDSNAPAAPSGLATAPASPANENDPRVTGTAEAASTVTLYATADCTGSTVGIGTAAVFGGAGIDTSNVADDSTTSYSATATDAAGNASACSTAISYVEDSTAPVVPSGLGTAPASPANDNDPRVTGTAEAGSSVTVYATADCTGASAGSGSAATFGGAGIDVPNVSDDTTTSYTAKATDAAGNVSACSSAIGYVEDSTAPAAPSGLGTSPASPANDNDPRLTGTAEAGSTVTLYATADCTGASVGSGSAATFGGAGVDVANVADDSTTTYTATATDAAGNVSPCSTTTTYVEDSVAPSAPSSLDTLPASPANDNDPKLIGGSQAGTTVTIYASADCSGAATGSGTAGAFAGAGIDVANVADNSTTTYSAKATDAAGNASPCSSPVTYVEDSAAPNAPTIDSSSPASPANDNDPELRGTAEAGSTVRVYTNASCTSAVAASGGAAAFNSPGLTVSVADNTTTNFYATATDGVGNVSGCSPAAFAYAEQSGVLTPTNLATTPAGPANDTNPKVAGTAEPGMTIRVYTSADCSGAPVATGTTAQFASPGLNVAVGDDTTTQFRATADDGGGNISSCSDPVTYVEDSTPPAAPDTLASSPGSPANENDPEVTGSAAAGSTVSLYSTADCSGAPYASGTAASFASPGFTVSVANDTTTAFTATATDSAGNTSACSAAFTYVEDSTAPGAPSGLGTAPASPANDNDPAVTGGAEAGATVRVFTTADCSGAPAASGTAAAFGGAGLSVNVGDGSTTTFKATATDGAGNTSACSAGVTYVEDSTAPSSSTSFPSAGGEYRAATWADFSGTASDAGAGLDRVELSIERLADGQFWNGSGFASSSEDWHDASGTASWSYSFPVGNHAADGQYRVRVRAVDKAGNAEAPASRTYTIDRIAPNTTIDSGPPSASNSEDASFSFSSNESGVSYECSLDGGAAASCTSPKNYTGLGEGSHTFDVRATDAAGNADPSPATHTWVVDLTDPSAAYSFPAAGGSYNAAGWNDFSGTAADSGGAGLLRVEVSIRDVTTGNYWDGSSFAGATQSWHTASGTSSWTLSFPASNFQTDGDYEVRVRAVDNATNASGALLRSFTVDGVPPETTIDSGPSGNTASADANFAFSADQPGSTFECRLDGSSWTSCVSPRSYTGLAEGAHSFDVRATDAGNNTDPTPASRNWFVDTLLPTAALDTPASWIRQTVTLTASATDSGSGIASVRFDRAPAGSGSWTPLGTDGSAPFSFDFDTTAVANGLYDFRVVATDNAGNPQASNTVTNIHVDNTAPSAVMDDPGAAVSGSVALAHSSTDPDSGIATVQFQFRALPAGAWTDTSATWDTTVLTDGQHELRVVVTDRAGNEATSAAATTLVDNTVPTVAYTVPTEGGFVNAASNDPLTLAASANDLGSGVDNVEFFDCTAGGASCTSSSSLGSDSSAPYEASWPVPADGPRYLKAVATDNAGRQASTVVSVTVDRTVPDTTLLSNPGTPSNNPTPTFTFSSNEAGGTFECRVDGGPWSTCSTPHTTAPLSDGNRTFEVRALDAAANPDSTPASWSWLLDATAPVAAIDDPGANLRLAIGLTSTQSDPGAFASGIATVQYEYSVADAETWVSADALWDTTSVLDGLYDLRVTVTDNAGNVTSSTPVEDRRVDNTAPATSHDDPGANIRQTVTLVGQASDDGSGVQQVDFQISPTGMSSWTTIGLGAGAPYQLAFDTATYTDGLYDFRTVARDVAGNQTEGTPVVGRRIDNTPPIATMNDPGANLRGTVNLTSVADDPGGSGVSSVVYEYSPAGGGAWQPISATWATDTVADGVYDLHVVVRDVAGNETISAPVGGRRVDNTAPTTGHNAPSGWQSGSVTVSLSADDAGGSGVSNTQFAVDGGSWQSGTSVSLSADGIHTISFFSTDVAGNVESPRTATVMIDSTPPPAGANDPGNYLRGTVTLSADADTGGEGAPIDNVSFQYSPAGADSWNTIAVDNESPYSIGWNTGSMLDGAYDLRFEVTDTATPPNVSSEDLDSKIIDNTAPVASMGSPLNGSVVSGGVTLGVSATDDNPIKSVEYFVRGSSVGASTSAPFQGSWNSASAGDGSADIYAVVEDMAGNTTTTNTITVLADNFAPSVSISSPGPAVRGTVALGASADGDTVQVTFERRPVGGGGWTSIGTATGAPWAADFVTTAVADGDYELRAIATDAGGNSGTSNVVTTKVDNTNPNGTLTDPGNGELVGGPAVALAANAGDAGSGVANVTFQYTQTGFAAWADIASASSAPYQATWDTTPLTSVAHDVRIVVTDVAGNQFVTGPTTVVVDSTAPGVTFDDPGAELSGTVALSASTTGDADVVTFAYSPAGASSWTTIASDGSQPWGASFNTTTVPDGMYDLRAVAADAVGNTSSSVRAGVRIDNFMPVLTSSNPANGSIVASADSVVLNFSEAATLSNLLLDGNPAPCVAPCAGSSVTLNTGPLANGSHTVTGTAGDAAGNSSSFSISFVVGVPAPPPASGGEPGSPFELPVVPMPTDFHGELEADGTLTLGWTPAKVGSTPLATVLFVDGIATISFAPGESETNLGAFDPADLRTFSVAAVGADGRIGPDTAKLRSTSLLAGKSLAEAEAGLLNRGFRLGAVRGSGSIVVEPRTALMAPLESAVDLTLGEPTAPETKLVFHVVSAKTFSRKLRKYIALRVKATRPAQVTSALMSPRGARVYRWRFGVDAGAGIVRLTMPPQARAAGRYRLVFTAQAGRSVVKRTLTIRVLGSRDRAVNSGRPEVVLAGVPHIRGDVASVLEPQGVRLSAATGDDEAFDLAGHPRHNVRVIVVDVDRYGVRLVRDLRIVFPGVRILALTNDPRRLAQAMRSGATIAVPRSTPPKDLAKLIARLARR